jgi:hypothetical protein
MSLLLMSDTDSYRSTSSSAIIPCLVPTLHHSNLSFELYTSSSQRIILFTHIFEESHKSPIIILFLSRHEFKMKQHCRKLCILALVMHLQHFGLADGDDYFSKSMRGSKWYGGGYSKSMKGYKGSKESKGKGYDDGYWVWVNNSSKGNNGYGYSSKSGKGSKANGHDGIYSQGYGGYSKSGKGSKGYDYDYSKGKGYNYDGYGKGNKGYEDNYGPSKGGKGSKGCVNDDGGKESTTPSKGGKGSKGYGNPSKGGKGSIGPAGPSGPDGPSGPAGPSGPSKGKGATGPSGPPSKGKGATVSSDPVIGTETIKSGWTKSTNPSKSYKARRRTLR